MPLEGVDGQKCCTDPGHGFRNTQRRQESGAKVWRMWRGRGGWRERFARAKRCSTARGQRRRPRRLPNNALLRTRACTSLWHRSFQAAPPALSEMCAFRACVPWQAMRRSLLVAGVAATLLADPAAVRARARADLAGAHLLDACARRQRAPAAACRHPRGTCAIHSRLTAQAHARQLIIAPDANASALTDANAWALGFSYLLRV